MDWSVVAKAFEPDGALRDIYVHDATLADWQAVLDFVRGNYTCLQFTLDGQPTVLPTAIAEIFAARGQFACRLNFDVRGIDIVCHFFSPTEIEFDLRPEEVTGAESLAAVTAFLRGLSAVTDKTCSPHDGERASRSHTVGAPTHWDNAGDTAA